jgi:hypothetical protein
VIQTAQRDTIYYDVIPAQSSRMSQVRQIADIIVQFLRIKSLRSDAKEMMMTHNTQTLHQTVLMILITLAQYNTNNTMHIVQIIQFNNSYTSDTEQCSAVL